MNLTIFSSDMADSLPSRNMEYAVRIHGTFPTMKVRAIPAQHKPYPTLADAAKTQAVYTYTNTTGTVVGFYSPVYFAQLDVVGFHLHFISDDRQTGGHILDFTVPENTTVEYDITPVFTMVLPTNGTFTSVNLSQDVSSDLEKVER
jgi:acetolactate decarboxylase